jgi:hypothetical protein
MFDTQFDMEMTLSRDYGWPLFDYHMPWARIHVTKIRRLDVAFFDDRLPNGSAIDGGIIGTYFLRSSARAVFSQRSSRENVT